MAPSTMVKTTSKAEIVVLHKPGRLHETTAVFFDPTAMDVVEKQIQADLESLPKDARDFINGEEFKQLVAESYRQVGGNVTRETYSKMRERFRTAIQGDVPPEAFSMIDVLTERQREAIFKYASKGKPTLTEDAFVHLVSAGVVEILKATDANKYRLMADHWKAASQVNNEDHN